MTREELRALMQKEMDGGNVIEAGWLLNMKRSMPDDIPKFLHRAMRQAFFIGAGFVLETILHASDAVEEAEITAREADAILDVMQKEMGRFFEANREFFHSQNQGVSKH